MTVKSLFLLILVHLIFAEKTITKNQVEEALKECFNSVGRSNFLPQFKKNKFEKNTSLHHIHGASTLIKLVIKGMENKNTIKSTLNLLRIFKIYNKNKHYLIEDKNLDELLNWIENGFEEEANLNKMLNDVKKRCMLYRQIIFSLP